MIDIDDFKQEVECIYKDEKYAVRDNGAVFRYPRDGKRPRKYDNFWTFGKANDKHGYMEIASVRVHIIVATAFHGPKPVSYTHLDVYKRQQFAFDKRRSLFVIETGGSANALHSDHFAEIGKPLHGF